MNNEVMPACEPVGLWIEALERERYGMTVEEAVKQSICIECKEGVNTAGMDEWRLRVYQATGFCLICFSKP